MRPHVRVRGLRGADEEVRPVPLANRLRRALRRLLRPQHAGNRIGSQFLKIKIRMEVSSTTKTAEAKTQKLPVDSWGLA